MITFRLIKEISKLPPKGLYYFIFHQQWMSVLLLHIIAAFGMISIFDFSHYGSVMVSYCFNLKIPSDIWIEYLFKCLFIIFIFLLVRCPFRFFAHYLIIYCPLFNELFIFLMLRLKSSLYILDAFALRFFRETKPTNSI